MLVNSNNLSLVFEGFKAVYSDAFKDAPIHWNKIAMQIASTGASETYGWIGQFPQLREWISQRVVSSLQAHSFKIQNRDFESTVSVHRNFIADDQVGVFRPAFSETGHQARLHPEELIFDLLSQGFVTDCYDGQNFFDADHPVEDKDGNVTSVSNMQDGTEPAWFLLDTSRAIRPIIWQEREPYSFVAMTDPSNPEVFMSNHYIYGVQARVNAGFGLWQLAFGSKAPLTSANYALARQSMMKMRSGEGRILGVRPTVMVVPPELEDAALHLLNTTIKEGGGSNPYHATAGLIVSPYASTLTEPSAEETTGA